MLVVSEEVVSLDERRLLLRHREGDPAAFGELVSLYRSSVFGYLVRSGVPRGHQEDLFQEIFLRVHKSAGQYQSDRALKPWLFAIVTNVVRSHYRKLRVRQLISADPQAVDEAQSALPSSEELSQAQQTARWLEQALKKLPLKHREVIILCAVEKMSPQDAAKALGANLSTVKTNLRRARIDLAKQLQKRDRAASREQSR